MTVYINCSRSSARSEVTVRVGVVEDGWYNNSSVSESLFDRCHVHLIGEIGITRHCLRVLILGLVENNRSPLGNLGLCNDLANVAGIVVGCIEETWISCARYTRVPR
jgi:hypothetical protein